MSEDYFTELNKWMYDTKREVWDALEQIKLEKQRLDEAELHIAEALLYINTAMEDERRAIALRLLERGVDREVIAYATGISLGETGIGGVNE